MTGTCAACGANARLGPDGVCAWQAGCEHRQQQAEAMERQIDAQVARLDRMVDGTLREWLTGEVDPVQRVGVSFPTAPDPYDLDLLAYHERCVEALGAPVCVHCIAQAN